MDLGQVNRLVLGSLWSGSTMCRGFWLWAAIKPYDYLIITPIKLSLEAVSIPFKILVDNKFVSRAVV